MSKISKFKVVFVGDQNVGKTSIISRFIQDSFQQTSNPTVGIDFVTKTMQVQGQTLRLQLWDTAGQQRFRSLIPSYVRDADICLIVLDLSVRASYQNLNKWLDFVRQTRGIQGLILIVGNKSDIVQRQIQKKQLQDYCKRQQCPYMQVSAKEGTNISLLFRTVSQKLIQQKNGAKKQDLSLNQNLQSKQQVKKQNISLSKEKHIQSGNINNAKTCNC